MENEKALNCGDRRATTMPRSAIKSHEFPHMTTAASNDEAFIYVKVNLQYLRKVRHTLIQFIIYSISIVFFATIEL